MSRALSNPRKSQGSWQIRKNSPSSFSNIPLPREDPFPLQGNYAGFFGNHKCSPVCQERVFSLIGTRCVAYVTVTAESSKPSVRIVWYRLRTTCARSCLRFRLLLIYLHTSTIYILYYVSMSIMQLQVHLWLLTVPVILDERLFLIIKNPENMANVFSPCQRYLRFF